MKIGILTFHCAINYGAVLQAYGLKDYLTSLGHDVAVIDFRPEYLTRHTRVFRVDSLNGKSFAEKLKILLRECIVAPVRYRRQIAFRSFCRKRLNLGRIDFEAEKCGFDALVFGSDQIWNPVITEGYEDVYFGNFPSAGKSKCIAYAASAGFVGNLTDLSRLGKLLENFSCISVREESLACFLGESFPSLKVYKCLDPVLLAGRAVFDKIAAPKVNRKPYLFLFQLAHDERLFQIARRIATEKSLEIVELTSYTESLANKNFVNVASPQQMLALVRDAGYVVTNSFHGTVFSILYRKNFNTVCFNEMTAERILDLLRSFGLEDRLYTENAQTGPVDYSVFDEQYENRVASSGIFLNEALSI